MHRDMTSSSFRILLVEGGKDERQAFCRAFRKSDVRFEITECEQAELALERLKDEFSSFDVVVVSLHLSGMSGLEFCQELLDDNIPLPLIVLAENGSEHLAVSALEVGVSDYLIKDSRAGYLKLLPIILPKVVRQYHEHLTRRQTEKALRNSEERYRTLIEADPHGIEECDTSGIITFANPASHRMFGYTNGELLGTAIWDRGETEEERGKSRQFFARLLKEQSLPAIEYMKNVTKDGRAIDNQINWNCKHDEQGRLTGFISIITDITEQKRAEKALQQRTYELALLNEMNNLLQACRSEEETYLVVINVCKQLFPSDSGFLYIMDESRTVLKEVSYWGSPPPEPRIFGVDNCWALRRGKVHCVGRPDTGLLCPHLSSAPPHGYLCVPINASGGALGMLNLCLGISEPYWTDDMLVQKMESRQVMATRVAEQYSLSLINLRLRETLRVESIRDPLTGLYNRRHMEASLKREAHRAERRNTPVALIMLDIDHFKKFNDTYGHEAGDIVLRELGRMMRGHIRAEDIACRYGGEEFLLILPEASISVAERRAEELRLLIRDFQISYQGKVLIVTVSLGVAAFPNHGPDIKDAVKAADSALYRAKIEGRDRVVIASS